MTEEQKAVAAFKNSIKIYLAFAGGPTADILPYLLKFVDFTDDLLVGKADVKELYDVAYVVIDGLCRTLVERARLLPIPLTASDLSDFNTNLSALRQLVNRAQARKQLLLALRTFCCQLQELTKLDYPLAAIDEGLR